MTNPPPISHIKTNSMKAESREINQFGCKDQAQIGGLIRSVNLSRIVPLGSSELVARRCISEEDSRLSLEQ